MIIKDLYVCYYLGTNRIEKNLSVFTPMAPK